MKCCRGDTISLLGLLLSSWWVKASTAVDTTIIVLTVAQNDLATSNTSNANFTGDESSGHFPLSNALESVMRLAADDINAGASEALGLTEGILKMAVAEVNNGAQAMEGFCNALEAVIGKNGTFGVSTAVRRGQYSRSRWKTFSLRPDGVTTCI